MNSIETVALPDLSALDVSVRRRMAVAGCLGAAWDSGRWLANELVIVLQFPGASFHDVLVYVYADGAVDFDHIGALPDYEHDPAAWGVLLSTELHGYDTDAERGIRCWFYRDEGMRLRNYGPYEATLPAAVVSCVLVKFGAYSDELRTAE